MATSDVIADRLAQYERDTGAAEDQALREILQHVVLYGLSNAGFFSGVAAFQGGTALRMAHGLPRFSEDLDFALLDADPEFSWEPFDAAVREACEMFGIAPEITTRNDSPAAVKAMWLKDDSLGHMLELRFVRDVRRKLRVKLEIDTRPPAGAIFERRFLDFPVSHPVELWDLPSSFGGKLHALLCRRYLKGRDWFDLAWYVRRRVRPNLPLLSNALNQVGPWAGQGLEIDGRWLIGALRDAVAEVDWERARADVAPFLAGPERDALAHWGTALFGQTVDGLARALDVE